MSKQRKGGHPPRVKGTPAKRTFVVRMTPQEYERLQAAADAAGEHMSAFTRKAIEQRAKRYGGKG